MKVVYLVLVLHGADGDTIRNLPMQGTLQACQATAMPSAARYLSAFPDLDLVRFWCSTRREDRA
jgi:hypothetical protein